MNEQTERIKTKISQLKKLDKDYILFGSQNHRYRLNPIISLERLQQFEFVNKIVLPKDYVAFLANIGNGGVGPFYGLEPLEDSLFDDLDYKRPESLLNPSKPFLHTNPWNLEFNPNVDDESEEYETQLSDFEEKYFGKDLMNGTIAICNFGCGVNLNLVVNGREYGNIWTDDRGSDNGIHPSSELGNTYRIGFLNWYELWLDNSMNEINSKFSVTDTTTIETKQIEMGRKKPWWKFW
ncbi:MAG: SMI1/KNR4 family protein [Bacteroidota bacterium]